MKTLPRVASEMALHVLAYNLTRVMNIMGIGPLMAAIGIANPSPASALYASRAGRFHTTKTLSDRYCGERECPLLGEQRPREFQCAAPLLRAPSP